MDYGTIFALITKGVRLIPTLIEAGRDIAPLVENIATVSHNAADGTVTEEQITKLESDLDQLLIEFNEPME